MTFTYNDSGVRHTVAHPGPGSVADTSEGRLSLPRRGGVRVLLAVAGVGAVVGLAACSSSGSQPSGGGMMGGSQTVSGMMGGSSPGGGMGSMAGYQYAPLKCSAPASLPGQTVVVSLGDMGMSSMMGGDAPMGARMMLYATPGTVPAGQVSVVVSNLGWRTHEVVVLPLPAGTAAGKRVPGADGKVDEAGSLGEASNSCVAGSGEGITSGSVGWTTLTLAPGRYELVCNLKNHYANGMYQEIVVT
ncbi:MAG TPA: hypothetical protein VES01_06160 [Dermatophilaceae bacterium]|nr:hypothetical protein [Dermatophilaceae bacterium]